jgi:hypothetical protein
MASVKSGDFLKGMYNSIKKLGNKAVSSDSVMIIDGFEDISLLIKQFPWPTLTPQGEIEVPTPLGGGLWQPQQVKVNQQGAIMIAETEDGIVADFLNELNANQGGIFDAKMYEGTPDEHTRLVRIQDCFFQMDNPDRDHENRSQILAYSGTLFFHYFGDDE